MNVLMMKNEQKLEILSEVITGKDIPTVAIKLKQ